MLYAAPRGIFSWNYTVRAKDDTVIADIDMVWFGESAEVTIGGQGYTVRRESVLHGTFALLQGDRVLARAHKVSAFSRAFDVDLAGRPLELKALSVWSRRFGLFENNAQIGWIGPSSWLGRIAVTDLPDNVSMPAQVFLLWLVLILWRRAANSSAASG
jgi:hypothetical protein